MIADRPRKFNPMVLNCPEIWALAPSEFKLYVALLSFADRNGEGAFPSNSTLEEMVGVKERALQVLLKSLEDKNIITRSSETCSKGTLRTITVNYAVQTIEQIGRINLRSRGATDNTPRGAVENTPGAQSTAGDHSCINNGIKSSSSEESLTPSQQQPEESLSSRTNLPNPKAYTPESLAPRKGAVLTEVQRNLAAQLLGVSGQDKQFAASVSQEMANLTGFLEYYLKATIKASKERKIKGSTIAYLIGSLNNSWNNGDWVDPDQAAKDQKTKEIAARRARLDRLT